jgi:hypothetical protein
VSYPAEVVIHCSIRNRAREAAVRSKQTKLQPERIRGEFCLNVAFTGAEILVVVGWFSHSGDGRPLRAAL